MDKGEKRVVVVFDFDGTLVNEDTFLTFARHALGWGRLLAGLFRALPYIVLWKTGLVTNSLAKNKMYAFLYSGRRRAEILHKAESFHPRLNRDIYGRLLEHKRVGHKIYIISASLDLWLKAQASRMGVNLLCTATENSESGTLTGRFASPNCYGHEKVRRLLEAEPNRDEYVLAVYGDSKGDEPLLDIADVPFDLRYTDCGTGKP